jgi:hypothetical protein
VNPNGAARPKASNQLVPRGTLGRENSRRSFPSPPRSASEAGGRPDGGDVRYALNMDAAYGTGLEMADAATAYGKTFDMAGWHGAVYEK